MNRISLTLLIFLIFSFAIASARLDKSEGKIVLDGNMTVTIYHENESGIPDFVSGTLSAESASGAEISSTIKFFENNKSTYEMNNPAVELSLDRIDIDQLGMKHLRFRQMYNNIRVFGGDLISHFSADGILKTVNGNYESKLNLNTTATVLADNATAIAVSDLQSFFADGTADTPELIVFPWNDTNYLCWRFYVNTTAKMGRWEYFVSADDGSIIFKANRIMDSEEIGTGNSVLGQPRNHIDTWYNGVDYKMIDHTRQANNDLHGHGGQMPDGNVLQTYVTTVSLPGVIAVDADNDWSSTISQGPAVDAHVFGAMMYDWMLNAFGRNSFDDAGASMYSTVEYSAEGNNNAYWNGYQIVVWSAGTGWRSLAGCPDVIAHEWAHAITDYTSNLWYQKESGALNESFSDMIGCAYEFAHDTLDVPDWYMGENGAINGNGFRNIANPPEFGDPDTYKGAYWQEAENCSPSNQNDWCGVHTNSGVGNKWFYLLSEGGNHNFIAVTGVGVENAIQVAYRANAFYWTPTSTYLEAAMGTITAANDLDASMVTTQEVIKAWHAVNVMVPEPSLAFDYDGGAPHTVEPDNPTVFEVTVSGTFGATPVQGLCWLYYSIDGAEYAYTLSEYLGSNVYRVTLPNVQCGQTLSFYLLTLTENYGPKTDPADIADAYQPVIVVSSFVTLTDDFETDIGWTSGGTALAGDWERGVPVGDGSYGDPVSDYDGSGQCYLTENVPGESDIDGGDVWLESPVFDLSAGSGDIVYALWYNNAGGPNPLADIMTVSISNNNGTDWTLAQTYGPTENASGDWIVHSFYTGGLIEPTNEMKVRFVAEDIDGSSWVEVGLDDFHVIYYDCPTYICGDLDDEGNINILDIVYLINNIYKNGDDPDPLISADVNHDSNVNILDIILLINYIYKDGIDPVCRL